MRPLLLLLAVSVTLGISAAAPARPNIVVIFMDDLGHNDVGFQTYPKPPNHYPNSGPAPNFGANSDPDIPQPNKARLLTPAIDSLASQGLQMTSFYATRLCSPSRASLLCGRYDRRVNITSVFFPTDTTGLSTREVTLPEVLRQAGYHTGMVGKWHLGYRPAAAKPFQMMPTRHGFQEFFGTPHSNDMANFHLIENETVLDPDFSTADEQAQITWRYTEAALDFIQRKSADAKPFFLYLAHTMTHIPCWPSDREFANADGTTWPKFEGLSGAGNYYDIVMEIDHSVSRVLTKLDELGIADNTLVIFTSDNGPWLNLSNINAAERAVGSAYPLKDGKFTTWEGGVRVPFVVRWPGKIQAGSSVNQVGGLVDLLPTLGGIGGGGVPADRTVDGVDLWPAWSAGTVLPERFYAFHEGDTLAAVTRGNWKLRNGALYDLANDFQELSDLAGNPANAPVLAELQAGKSAISASLAAENEPRGTFTAYEVELSTDEVTVREGETASIQVRLSANPAGSVTVNTAFFSGDANLAIASGGALNFDHSNWSVWQTVTLGAAQDADAEPGGATFRVTMSGLNVVREVFAFEIDDEAPAPVTSSLVWPKADPAAITGNTVKLLTEGRAQFGAAIDPPGSLYSWGKVSGPGTVTFTAPSAIKTGVQFGANGVYQLRLTSGHPDAGASGSVDFVVDVGAANVGEGGLKYPPRINCDASQDLDGNAVWQNLVSPGVGDVALSSGVAPRAFSASTQSAAADCDPTGELAAQFGASAYIESATGGLDNSVAIALANTTVASFDGTQSISLPSGGFVTGASVTVGAYFKLGSFGTATGISGQILRLGLTNGGADNFDSLPFSTIELSNTTTGAAKFVLRDTNGGQPALASFDLNLDTWYYFETTFTRSASNAIDYEMLLAPAAGDGTLESVLANDSAPGVSSGLTSTQLDKAIYGGFKGHQAYSNGAIGVLDNFSVSTALPGSLIDPAPSLSFIDSALDLPGGLTMEGGVSDSLDAYGTGDASFEFWFKPATLPVPTRQVLWETGGDIGVSMSLDGSMLTFVVDDGSTNAVNGAAATATLAPNAAQDGFVHAAGVIDLANDQIRLYIDGGLADTQAIPGVADWCGTSGTGLGKIDAAAAGSDGSVVFNELGGNDHLSPPIQAFAGWMAIARFYDQALSSTAVAELNADPLAPAVTGNIGPVVSAGSDQSATTVNALVLSGSASDDGNPEGAPLTTLWTQLDGPDAATDHPALVSFGDAASPATTANFGVPGSYTLWLEADDSLIKVFDSALVSVAPLGYADWAAAIAFAPEEGDGIANPDQDRFPNLWEWVLGSDPLASNSSDPGFELSSVSIGTSRNLTIEFAVPRDRQPDIFFLQSSDLQSWERIFDPSPVVVPISDTHARWTFSYEVPATQERCFLKAGVSE